LIFEQQASLLLVRNNKGMHIVSLFKAISLFWLFWQDPLLQFQSVTSHPSPVNNISMLLSHKLASHSHYVHRFHQQLCQHARHGIKHEIGGLQKQLKSYESLACRFAAPPRG
jgi:hypothetical protein